MARHRFEVADVVRTFRPALLQAGGHDLACSAKRVLNDIVACRTRVLGGHVDRCDRCGHQELAYNSCRNRHCPKCQASAREKWLRARESELLPIPYYHVVFTLPAELRAIAMHNPRVMHEILFRSSSQTLKCVARDPKHLGAEVGILSILHTWGQQMEYHPHVHCVVTGGGIAGDSKSWVACRDGFFAPVRVLSRLYRGKALHAIRAAHRAGRLRLEGRLGGLQDPDAFKSLVRALYEKEWVVYAKAPFGGPAQVLRYLSRYTHRVAISNGRLVGIDQQSVSFTWKDYAHGCKQRLMRLPGTEFLRRFLLHVLPKGLVRIRHSGFLSNAKRTKSIERCRELLGSTQAAYEERPAHASVEDAALPCPECKAGHMRMIYRFDPGEEPRGMQPRAADT